MDWARGYLRAHGVDSAALDAEVLLAHVTGLNRAGLYRESERPLPAPEAQVYRRLVERRGQREPVAYLTGKKEFMGLEFLVDPSVLIPRPETELLVEKACALAKELLFRRKEGSCGEEAARKKRTSCREKTTGGGVTSCREETAGPGENVPPPEPAQVLIAEAGTGSGAIAVSLAVFLPSAGIYATDCSPAALEVAEKNARRHGVAERISFLPGDLLAPLFDLGLTGRIDLIVANLPYVPTAELPALMPDVRRYEPLLALDGGPDGLALYRRLLPQARRLLSRSGRLLLETGPGQGEKLGWLFTESGWRHQLIRDLAGRERIIQAALD